MLYVLSMIVYSPYLACLSFFLLFYYFFKKKMYPEVTSNWTIGLFVLFIWSIIVGVFNLSLPSTLTSFLFLGLALLSVYLQNEFTKHQEIEKWYYVLFFLALGSAFIALLAKFNIITYSPAYWKFFIGTRSIDDIGEPHRVAGTFNNPNIAGSFYAMMVLIGYYFYQRKQSFQKVFILLALLLYVAVLLWTGSRGGIIGLFVGFIFYFYFSGHKKKMLFLMFSILGIVSLMLHQPDWFPRGDILFSSIQDRQAIWLNCIKLFLEKPHTGWGIFGIYYADPTIYNYLQVFHAHNIPLSIATMLGAGGLAVCLWMSWNLFQDIRYLYHQQCPITPLLSGLFGIILGQGLVDFIIMSPQIAIMFIATATFISTLSASYKMSSAKITLPLAPYKGFSSKKLH